VKAGGAGRDCGKKGTTKWMRLCCRLPLVLLQTIDRGDE